MNLLTWVVAFTGWLLFAISFIALLAAGSMQSEQPKPEHYSERWESENNE